MDGFSRIASPVRVAEPEAAELLMVFDCAIQMHDWENVSVKYGVTNLVVSLPQSYIQRMCSIYNVLEVSMWLAIKSSRAVLLSSLSGCTAIFSSEVCSTECTITLATMAWGIFFLDRTYETVHIFVQ